MDQLPEQSLRERLPANNKYISYLLRTFFNLLYHQFAWAYDWVAALVSLGIWQEWVLSILPYLHGPHILELGHGPGHLQIALHQKVTKIIGLDLSPQMGRLAYQRLRKRGITPLLVNAQAQNLPFSNGSIHQVVATFPTEYIADPLTLKEIYRLLSPNGELIILLFAWIKGSSLPTRAAAWLFDATGESPEWDERALEAFRTVGFQARAVLYDYKWSRLLVIQAAKSPQK